MTGLVRVAKATITAAAVVVAVVAVALAVGIRTDLLRISRVLSGSMEPTVPVGAVAVATRTDATDLHVGDLVMFKPPAPFGTPGGDPIVHRVASITHQHGTLVLTTKGDANPSVDPWRLDGERSTVYRYRFDSGIAGSLLVAVHRAGPAAVAVVVVIPLWLALLRRLWGGRLPLPRRRSRPVGRHRAAPAR